MTINVSFRRYYDSMKFLLKILICLIATVPFAACIEDGVTTSPSDQPVFSTDTLRIGEVFTGEVTPTFRFTVYNPAGKSIMVSNISVSGPDAALLHINVDGISGTTFSDVEIRGKDSVFVFVEARIPEDDGLRRKCEASVDFTTNGVKSSLPVKATGINAVRLRAQTITDNMCFDSPKPYIIYDSLVVAPGAGLTLAPGTRLCFHDKASLVVRGTLRSEGTSEAPVAMAGDRTGNVVGNISFDIMSRQWSGVVFASGSTDNVLSHTVIRNTVGGVRAEESSLSMTNCRLTNSGGVGFEAINSNVEAAGCEFSEASAGLVSLDGGRATFAQCTFANNYLFTVVTEPAIRFAQNEYEVFTPEATFSNSIIYGLGPDLSHGELTGAQIYFRNCLFRSKGTDDDNFIGCVWDADPLYYTVRNEYLFDYRLREGSPAIGVGDATLNLPAAAVDFYGVQRGETPDLGAYVYQAPE